MRLFRKARGARARVSVSADEHVLIKRFIRPGDVVFDIGAHSGDWTEAVLCAVDGVTAHAFEASPDTFRLLQEHKEADARFRVVEAHHLAISNREKELRFFHYPDAPKLSTAHRRVSVEDTLMTAEPERITVPATSIDQFCGREEIPRINYLKVDVEGAEYDVLRGCVRMLRSGAIDFVQFEYGGTYLDAGVTLRMVGAYMAQCGYVLFRMRKGRMAPLQSEADFVDDYKYANLLAVNRRLARTVDKKFPRQSYDIFRHLGTYRAQPRGIVHVGAHSGKEIEIYDRAGVERVVFVEANPRLAADLRERFVARDDVTVIENAIADAEGTLPFHITSMDQSSSLLTLHKHKEIYPKIRHAETISVEATTLDKLLADGIFAPGDYNVLALDIQGAELMALKGAKRFLRDIDAVHTEISFDELYKGGVDFLELDRFLGEQGFIRVRTVTPSHATWGDALYARPPKVTISNLGSRGRFGNHFFQYMFLRTYAKDRGYEVETPDWIGRFLFGADDPPLTDPSLYEEVKQTGSTLADCSIANATEDFPYADFNGFFQYRTNYYEPHKPFIRSLFSPSAEVTERLSTARAAFGALEGPVAGVHIRRGDYGYGHFFIAPTDWYLEWLEAFGGGEPVTVFLASDEAETVRHEFVGHNVVTAADLGAELPEAGYYPDFHFMTLCDALAISNSSFSFAAAMLNEKAETFMRPDLAQRKLVPFDPWNAEPLLRDARAEEHGGAFMHPKRRRKLGYRLRRLFGRVPR